MVHYGGIDVSLEQSSVCVVDATGRIVGEGKVTSDPEELIAWFGELGLDLARVGLKVGRTTPRRFAGHVRELVSGHSTLALGR